MLPHLATLRSYGVAALRHPLILLRYPAVLRSYHDNRATPPSAQKIKEHQAAVVVNTTRLKAKLPWW
ncbi:hypothetical protein GUJ93_ZPchr0006g44474 [Zizania palustris]|uniref:Uncharacterized protein n=1 Tax=Zizania palustris TaxID=103762 RepID=A0A8J5W4T2_ZIZPA|nr:hypothetical protein GUJ93_ZPchr0006g44474 [Zizania palustris]